MVPTFLTWVLTLGTQVCTLYWAFPVYVYHLNESSLVVEGGSNIIPCECYAVVKLPQAGFRSGAFWLPESSPVFPEPRFQVKGVR